MPLDVETLRSSLALMVSREPMLVRRIFANLLERHPSMRPMFFRCEVEEREQMVYATLRQIVAHVEDAPWMVHYLGDLGRRHAEYGVTRDMYRLVGECVLGTLAEVAGRDWTPPLGTAWRRAWDTTTGLMLAGVEREEHR